MDGASPWTVQGERIARVADDGERGRRIEIARRDMRGLTPLVELVETHAGDFDKLNQRERVIARWAVDGRGRRTTAG